MNGSDVVARNAELLTTEVDGELMAMNIAGGECFALDPVGTEIWALIAAPRRVDAIVADLLDRFDVAEADCRRDVARFLDEMRDGGLIVVTRGA